MAMANVGVELARTGRRVLLVDFDLEAPGLDTFNLPGPRPEESQPQGVVDFVLRYMEDATVPDFAGYHYESPGIGDKGGKLWIMPAGRQDGMYGDRFKAINWQDLYEQNDGYLLFEDLKQQWHSLLDPHYVLIDSRTGHTDIAGLCTRQMPDAVVALFFPNRQNLNGLKRIVQEIRAEETTERNKRIQIHFVMSNVPDLDDEEDILGREMRQFQESLGYRRLTGTIHHYDTLALLRQDVFTADRPKSRLAQEYRELTHSIVKENLEDREAAAEFLEMVSRRPFRPRAANGTETLDRRLDDIVAKHGSDGEILKRVARLRRRQGRLDESWSLLNQAVSSGLDDPESIKDRAMLAFELGHAEIAHRDAERFLTMTNASYFDVIEVIRTLINHDSPLVAQLPDSQAVRSLEPSVRFESAWELCDRRENLQFAEKILRALVSEQKSAGQDNGLFLNGLVLALIGQGKFRQAIDTLGEPTRESGPQDNFNFAMAVWGETGRPPTANMHNVILAEQAGTLKTSPNGYQCAAIAAWSTGDAEKAVQYAERARQLIMSNPRLEFSAWHYLRRNPVEFLQDVDEINSLISGANVRPPFFREAPQPEVAER
jgi:cellulose biosynthesis protein BcsQ